MATTHSGRGGSVDHSKIAASNETALLVVKLERLGWTHAQLSTRIGVSRDTVYSWSRGLQSAEWQMPSEAQRATLRKLSKAKLAPEIDHSPMSEREVTAHSAATDALMGPIKAPAIGIANKKAKRAKAPGDDKRLITLLVKDNPKRPGSKAHGRYAMYRTGMTVGEFLTKGGSSADIAYDLKHSYIAVK